MVSYSDMRLRIHTGETLLKEFIPGGFFLFREEKPLQYKS